MVMCNPVRSCALFLRSHRTQSQIFACFNEVTHTNPVALLPTLLKPIFWFVLIVRASGQSELFVLREQLLCDAT
ncbi:hypothetical protein IAD21_01388 [Abditibacteriota bacterium]|nr:hypothetical protein IAD21_01388 [Abditibacteriota bacterium]